MARHSARQVYALAVCIALGVPIAAALPAASDAAGSSPTPLASYNFPTLAGPQVKVEIGAQAPSGPAMTFIGSQNAWVNFSVWWIDPAAPQSAWVVVDGSQYAMTEVPGQDGAYAHGALFRALVNATDLATTIPSDHRWYFVFTNQSGSQARLPAGSGTTLGTLSLDRAEMFIDQSLEVIATQTLAGGHAAGTLATLRDVVDQSVQILDPQMSSHWNGSEVPYDYLDENHNITGPSALAIEGRELFVGQNGLQNNGVGDGGLFPGNSQPAHKQALALRGLLLASGLFNESDLVLMSETIDVNGTAFHHPYLRVSLLDGSEQPGDGTADNDTFIDVDLWAAGLTPPVDLGGHFGDDDNNTADDAPWTQSLGWPPVDDTQARYVLWPEESTFNTTTPSGTPLKFHVLQATIDAQATHPVSLETYWNDEPIMFDALASTQSMYLDMRFTWAVTGTGLNGAGPVWVWMAPVSVLGTYTVVLTATDVYGNQDQSSIIFIVRAKTELRQPIPDGSFDEDSFLPFDLRGYFGDQDGFGTINFVITTTPSQIYVDRNPATAPNFTFRAVPNWCGSGTATVNATDGASPVVSATFNLTVRCINDPPLITGLNSTIVIQEDGSVTIRGLSSLAQDADDDPITWTLTCSNVSMELDPLNDTMIFNASVLNWFGSDVCALRADDGYAYDIWTITFIVVAVNDPPSIKSAIPPQTIDEDTPNRTLSLDAYFADPDNEDFSAIVTAEAGLQAGYFAPLRQIWFHPTANYSGPTGFTVRAFDSSGANVSVHVDVQVVPVNDPPAVIEYEPHGPVTGTEGDLLIFVVQVIDSDSPVLTYQFYVDNELMGTGTSATFEWQTGFRDSGFHIVTAVASDALGANDSHSWQVNLQNANRAPSVMIQGPGAGPFAPGQSINLTADGSDPDGDDLRYEWTFGGAIQAMQGQNITFSFPGAGNYTVKVTASDAESTASATIIITVKYTPPPPPDGNKTDGNGTPNQSGFLPGPLSIVPVAAVGLLMALFARRRRMEE